MSDAAYMREWGKANRAKVRAWSARWRANNPDYVRKTKPRRNLEKQRANNARYRIAHREKVRAQAKAWRDANPIRIRETISTRRAREMSAPGGGLTEAQIATVFADSLGICAYCNERRPLTLEHIEPLVRNGEHDPTNAAAACRSCNCSKRNTPLLVWLARKAIAKSTHKTRRVA